MATRTTTFTPEVSADVQGFLKGSDLTLKVSGSSIALPDVCCINVFVHFPVPATFEKCPANRTAVIASYTRVSQSSNWQIIIPELPICGFDIDHIYRIGIQTVHSSPQQHSHVSLNHSFINLASHNADTLAQGTDSYSEVSRLFGTAVSKSLGILCVQCGPCIQRYRSRRIHTR